MPGGRNKSIGPVQVNHDFEKKKKSHHKKENVVFMTLTDPLPNSPIHVHCCTSSLLTLNAFRAQTIHLNNSGVL